MGTGDPEKYCNIGVLKSIGQLKNYFKFYSSFYTNKLTPAPNLNPTAILWYN